MKKCGIMCRGLGPQNCQFWGPLITKVIKFKISQFSAFTVLSIYSQLSWDFKSGSWIHELHDKAINLFAQLFCVGPLLGSMYCKKMRLCWPRHGWILTTQIPCPPCFWEGLDGLQPIFFSSNYRTWGIGTEKETIPKRSVVGHTWIYIWRVISAYL